MLNYKRLRELIEYDIDTGLMVWKVSHGFIKSGTRVAKRRVTIDGKTYQPGRLAWFYVYGRWPSRRFRFINGNSSDLRLTNLSESLKDNPGHRVDASWLQIARTENGFDLRMIERNRKPLALGNYSTFGSLVESLDILLNTGCK